MIAAGARLVGGCCGTTPQHIRAMREALDRLAPAAPRRARRAGRAGPGWRPPSPPASPPAPPPTLLQRKLDAGEFLVTVELDPPRGHNIEKLVQGAKLLKERGRRDRGHQRRLARAACGCRCCPPRSWSATRPGSTSTCTSPAATGTSWASRPICSAPTRMDIRNILAMTGDPAAHRRLRQRHRGLRRGRDRAHPHPRRDEPRARRHRQLDRRAHVVLRGRGAQPGRRGAGARDGALPRQGRRRARAGCRPSPSTISRCSSASSRGRARRSRLVVGILPLHSSRHAEFLHNEVPGITVPDAVRARMREAGERGLRAGIEMAQGCSRDVRAPLRRRLPDAVLRPLRGRGGGSRRAALSHGGHVTSWDAAEAARRIRAGTLSPSNLLAACLKRIDAVEPAVRPWVHLDRDARRAGGGAARHRGPRGALHGPAPRRARRAEGHLRRGRASPTTCGRGRLGHAHARRSTRRRSRALRGAGAVSDGQGHHHAVRLPRSRRADAQSVESRATRPAARRAAPPPRWPRAWCRWRSASQTVGSVLRPAAYCGVVGLQAHARPDQRGRACSPLAWSLDHVGVFARAVEDCALALSVLAGLRRSALGAMPRTTTWAR